MTEAQIALQNALTTTFLANLAFLSEYDNELYHRVDELSRMIENGTYKEKYALEFIVENGDFDIYDILNDRYLYNKNPKKMNNNLVQKVQFDEKNSILNISKYFTFEEPWEVTNYDKFNYEKLDDFVYLTQNNMYEYVNVTKDFIKDRKKIKKIKKFIFIGTLLARHIPKIAEKVDSNIYLVLERNLEIFRLSLFVIDYTIIAKNGVIFSIMDDVFIEEKKIYNFLNIHPLENYLIKFVSTGINIREYVDKILSAILNMDAVTYDYNRKLYSWINRTTRVLSGKYKILDFNKLKNTISFFENIPILYIAAGPSLDENIEWIKKNQDKFFIVTIGSAYKKLLSNNIKIDMITTLDEKLELSDLQFDDESVSKISNNTIILASTITNQKVLDKFKKQNLFLYEIFIPFHNKNVAFDGFSIGEITIDILIKINAKNIYLIGLDLALNQKTGDSHFKNSNSGVSVKINLNNEQSRESFDNRESLIKVKGNLQDEVFTTPNFYSSIKDLEKKLDLIVNDINIYNLSIHGAYFIGTKPINISEIEISTMKNLNIDFLSLRTIFIENSLEELTKESTEIVLNMIDFINLNLKEDLNKIKNTEFKSYEQFYNEVVSLSVKVFNNRCLSLFEILINYINLVIPYLSYYFNNKKIKNEIKKLNQIKEVFVKQLESILNDYINCLRRI